MLKSDEITFVFNKASNGLVDITFQETEVDLVKSVSEEKYPDGNYFMKIGEQKIWFNPASCKKTSGNLVFNITMSCFPPRSHGRWFMEIRH